VTKKADLLEQIEEYKSKLDDLKMKLKKEPKYITWAELPEGTNFSVCLKVANALRIRSK